MTSAGKRFGTTRIFHSGVLAPVPFRPYARISGGVFPSFPGQKGQFCGALGKTLSRRKSLGRFPRSVEIITHRPVIGSLRNSGNAFPQTDSRRVLSVSTPASQELYREWFFDLYLRPLGLSVSITTAPFS